ncbi:MAG TPA: hypothetical protein P5511_08445 [Candidatus Goldiibacteriota bacterium]|nr:hypothetical protein [Candidatus Goldiibacteriota bacterium]
MKKQLIGIMLGIVAGVFDVIPMIIQKLTWDANISAFCLWVVSGYILSIADIKVKPVIKGIIIPFLVLLPSAVLIGWKEPVSLIPITVMTLVLGSLMGFVYGRITEKA